MLNWKKSQAEEIENTNTPEQPAGDANEIEKEGNAQESTSDTTEKQGDTAKEKEDVSTDTENKEELREEKNDKKENEVKTIIELIDARKSGAGLKVDIGSKISLEDCLAVFTSPELLTSDNAFGCINCTRQFIRQKIKRNERTRNRTAKTRRKEENFFIEKRSN